MAFYRFKYHPEGEDLRPTFQNMADLLKSGEYDSIQITTTASVQTFTAPNGSNYKWYKDVLMSHGLDVEITPYAVTSVRSKDSFNYGRNQRMEAGYIFQITAKPLDNEAFLQHLPDIDDYL